MIIRFLASTDSNDKSLTHPRAPLPKSREGKGASLILF